MRKQKFENLLKVLRREIPDRPTLFEFALNDRLHRRLSGLTHLPLPAERPAYYRMLIAAYRAAGYDYAMVDGSGLWFPTNDLHWERGATISLNAGAIITDRASFDAYRWPDPQPRDYAALDDTAVELPDGMKFVVKGPGGVLENVILLTGFDNFCLMLADDPALVSDLFEAVGRRMVRHYELAVCHKAVGACIANDDWGFKTQTMISVADMRRYVFPWHRRIVEAVHAAGQPVMLHSCGAAREVMDDIIDNLGYDGKHSFEDVIQPVEEAYRQYGGRIAILGGMDVDFLVRAAIPDIRRRAQAMLDLAGTRGGYALGTGNSVPEYIPDEKFLALIGTATGL